MDRAGGRGHAEELENELGLDRGDVAGLIEVGKASELVQGLPLIEGEVLYSPFYGFELRETRDPSDTRRRRT